MNSKPKGGSPIRITLVFDGGSIGNPGPTYGSFLVRSRGLPQQPVRRLTWGKGTNNEAEYRALIGGLRELLKELEKHGIDPGKVKLRIAGDSRLVLNQVAGKWKVKSPRMRDLRNEALPLVESFNEVSFVHHDRKVSVRLLGH
jgi:ribonuclease HI